jgi:hypothetical protein
MNPILLFEFDFAKFQNIKIIIRLVFIYFRFLVVCKQLNPA